MATTFQDNITFAGDVSVAGTFTAAGVPSLQGLTLLVNGNAAAGTDEDPAIALLGGDGGTELIRTTFGQDSSADKAFIKMQGGAAGTTEKSMTLHVGALATTAAVNSTLVLEAGASSTNKPASLVNTGSTGVLAITGTTGVTLSDSVATMSLNAGALTETALASIDLTPSGASTLNPAGANSIESSAAAINIGANAVAQAVNVGTGAAARVITIGNAASASVSIDAGVGALTAQADTLVDIDAGGALSLNSSAGAINIGNDAVAQAVNIATGAAARVITVGNAASASLALEAGVGSLTANADVAITLNGGSGGIVLNGAPTGTATVTTSAGAGDSGKIPRLNGSGVLDSSITGATTVYRQVLERDSGLAQASTNTTIIRFTNAVQAAGSGCFTFTDSATDGSYITASVNCKVTLVTTVRRASGTVWIKSAASLSNALNATDTDIKGTADFAVSNEQCSATFYMAAGDKAWVACSAAPDGGFARINRFMVSADSV